MNSIDVAGVLVRAEGMVDGVLIDPELPADFDQTDNRARPPEQAFWWLRPYVVSYRDTTPDFLKHYPAGVRFDVRCLDGGAWDRSTWWATFPTAEDAVKAAKGPSPHGRFLDQRWPGRRLEDGDDHN